MPFVYIFTEGGGKERLYPPYSILGGCCVMVVEKPPYVKTTPDLQITNYIITIIQSYLPRNVPHARVGGLGDGVQNYDKCPGVPDAPKSANKSGQYGVGRGKVRKTRAHASVISQ